MRQWIVQAQAGSQDALGKLLEGCRDYLLGIANDEVDSQLRNKLGASDVVQETLLEAKQGIDAFRGTTEPELLAWVRRILQNNLLDARRYLHAEKRNVNREQKLNYGSQAEAIELANNDETPSALVSGQEDERRLVQALAQLPADYRMSNGCPSGGKAPIGHL